jgi:hypothetical protein
MYIFQGDFRQEIIYLHISSSAIYFGSQATYITLFLNTLILARWSRIKKPKTVAELSINIILHKYFCVDCNL